MERRCRKGFEAVKHRYSDSIDFSHGTGVSGHSLWEAVLHIISVGTVTNFPAVLIWTADCSESIPKKTMEKPFCQISCKENVNLETRPFVNTNADTYQVVFEDMKHMGFTDAKVLYYNKGIFLEKLILEEMFEHLVYCHLTFFDRYLKGRDVKFDGMPSDKIKYRKIF